MGSDYVVYDYQKLNHDCFETPNTIKGFLSSYELIPEKKEPKKLYAFKNQALGVMFYEDPSIEVFLFNKQMESVIRTPEYDIEYPDLTSN